MTERRLKVGDIGYFRVQANYYPAKVIADDICQTFGPIDEAIVFTRSDGTQCVRQTTDGYSSFDDSSWVTVDEYEQIRLKLRKLHIASFDKQMPKATTRG